MRNHKKLIALCNALQVNRASAIGHLHMLWWWAIENRESGDLTGLFDKDIAMACDWDLDPKLLIDALHSTEWLKDYQISDWDDYSWRLLGMRQANKERQRRYRAVTRDITRDVPPATVPNSTVPNQTKDNNRGRFAPPSESEVIEYFEKDLKASKDKALRFFSFYGMKGWVVGKNQMKNWHLAASRSLEWADSKTMNVVGDPEVEALRAKLRTNKFPTEKYFGK